MKRAITITSILLLALTVSCRKANTDEEAGGDKKRLPNILETATTKSVEDGTTEIEKPQEEADFDKISELLVNDEHQAAIDALDIFIKKYPENKLAKLVRKAVKKRAAMLVLRKEAYALFEKEKWGKALPMLEELMKKCFFAERADRTHWDKIRVCKYQLALVKLKAALDARDYEEASASTKRLKDIWPERYQREFEPTWPDYSVRRKVAATLARGAEALKNRQYSEVRKILDHLKDAYSQAAEMIRLSRYRENIAKGDAARGAGDNKRALAQYIIARKYAKTPAEREVIDALIAATAPDL